MAYSVEAWKTIALVCTITAWVCGGLGILSGIGAYYANGRAEIVKKLPRTVVAAPEASAKATAPAPAPAQNILIVSTGGDEAQNYATQIAGLFAGSHVDRFSIGFMPNAESGVSYMANGQDTANMMATLDKAGIRPTVSKLPMLPIPMSVQSRYANSVVLLVGPKAAD